MSFFELLKAAVAAKTANGEQGNDGKSKVKRRRRSPTEESLRGILGMLRMLLRIIRKCCRHPFQYAPDFFSALFSNGGLRQALQNEYGSYKTAIRSIVLCIACSFCFWNGIKLHYYRGGIFGIGYLGLFLFLSIWNFWSLYGLTNLHTAIIRADVCATYCDWSK